MSAPISEKGGKTGTLRSERSNRSNSSQSNTAEKKGSIVGHGTIGGNSSNWIGYRAKMRETQKVRHMEGSQKYEDSRSVSTRSADRRRSHQKPETKVEDRTNEKNGENKEKPEDVEMKKMED